MHILIYIISSWWSRWYFHSCAISLLGAHHQHSIRDPVPAKRKNPSHHNDVIMRMMESQITSVLIVCSNICSGADQRKHQKLCVTGLCEGSPLVTGGFTSQRASKMENVSIWWCHHDQLHPKPHARQHKNFSQVLQQRDQLWWETPVLISIFREQVKGGCPADTTYTPIANKGPRPQQWHIY